jgi:hypothetical protein
LVTYDKTPDYLGFIGRHLKFERYKCLRVLELAGPSMKTRRTIGVVTIAILLGLATILIFAMRIPPSEKGGAGTSSSGLVSQSSIAAPTTGGVRGNASLFFAMDVIPSDLLVPVGGNGNYTLVIHPGADVAGPYTALVKAPTGFSFRIDPTLMALSSSQAAAADVQVRS